MSTHFFTNRDNNNLLQKFEGVLENVPNLHSFDALVGYFRSSGYFKLRPFLENIDNIRILVGINVDKLAEKYHAIGQQYIKDPKETSDAFLVKLREDIEGADYNKETEDGVFQFISDLESLPNEIKALGINDYIFLDGYKKVKEFKEGGRLTNIELLLPVVELRINKSSRRQRHKTQP